MNERRRRRGYVSWRWAIRGIALSALLALLGWEARLMAPYLAAAADFLPKVSVPWLAAAAVVQLGSFVLYAQMQRRMVGAGGHRVPLRRVSAITYAANAINVTLPGGTALSAGYTYRQLHRAGASAPTAAFSVAATSILATGSLAVLGVVTGVLTGGNASWATLAVVGVIAAVAVVAYKKTTLGNLARDLESARRLANRLTRREQATGAAALDRFLTNLSHVKPHGRDWAAGGGWAAANRTADVASLVMVAHAVGAGTTSLVVTATAYVAGVGASNLSPVPGGIGIVDAAMIVALTANGVATLAATAVVVSYRLLSLVLVTGLGWSLWVVERVSELRSDARSRLSAPDAVARPSSFTRRAATPPRSRAAASGFPSSALPLLVLGDQARAQA